MAVRVGDGGVLVRALADTGCSQTIVSRRLMGAAKVVLASGKVVAVDGSTHNCGEVELSLRIGEQMCRVSCLVLQKQLPEFEVVLGMDVVQLLGGLKVGVDEVAQFVLTARRKDMDSGLSLEDVDFTAWFDGSRWIVR